MHIPGDISETFFEHLSSATEDQAISSDLISSKLEYMQQQFLEIQAAFICRTTFKNKDGRHPIILRLRFQGDRKDIFTGVYCGKTAWDKVGLVDSCFDMSV